MYSFYKYVLLLFFFIGVGKNASAQVTFNNFTTYSQNFNTLPSSGSASWTNNATISGWYATTGSTTSTTLVASNGSSTGSGLKSYGSSSETDRALGTVNLSGSVSYYGVRIKNNTGTTIKRFIISYTAEIWAKPNGNKTAVVDFDTQVGTTNLTSGTWVNQPAGEISRKTGGGYDKTLNGNLTSNRNKATFYTKDIYLANGSEIMLRWTDLNSNGVFVAIDDISITPTSANLYYSKSSGELTSLNTWGEDPDGKGTTPTSFLNGTFVIANRTSTATLNQNWVVTAPAKVVLAEGVFFIPDNYKFTGTIDVANNTYLAIANNVLPTFGTIGDNSTIILNGSGTQILPFASYSNLYIMGTGAKILSADTRISKGLYFSGGKLQLLNFNLTLEPGADIFGGDATTYAITNGTGSLVQEVANDNIDVVFPVGTSSYLPVKLRQPINAAVVTDNFKVRAFDGIFTTYTNNLPGTTIINKQAVNKTWIVDEEIKGGSDLTLTLGWSKSDALADFDPQQARIAHYYNSSWDDYYPATAVLTNGIYEISRSNITSFSPFAPFSGTAAPLPVELLNFTAQRSGNSVTCNWETATEKNNAHFTIERSLNGREFEALGKVTGAGTSNQLLRYSFLDSKAPQGPVYYRLRQTDFDGTVAFSQIVAVAADRQLISFQLYPNPTSQIQTLTFKGEASGEVEVLVRDVQGKLIDHLKAEASQLQQGLNLDLSAQPRGIYLVEILNGTERTMLRSLKH